MQPSKMGGLESSPIFRDDNLKKNVELPPPRDFFRIWEIGCMFQVHCSLFSGLGTHGVMHFLGLEMRPEMFQRVIFYGFSTRDQRQITPFINLIPLPYYHVLPILLAWNPIAMILDVGMNWTG